LRCRVELPRMAKVTTLIPANDTSAADWIVAALQTFGASVVSLVPSGYRAYARVFHPAYRFDPHSPRWETRTPVRWEEIAAANGTHVHAGMQLCGLTGSQLFNNRPQPDVFDHAPSEGSLPGELAHPLAAVLARHTATPDRCWFAVWNGFGATQADVRSAPTFQVPAREYHLLTGPIDAVAENVLDTPWSQSPNLWWPHDHAWCVATEIDLNTTYIGCTEACLNDMVESPILDALPIDPTTGISFVSDLVNPTPQATGGNDDARVE
jgi:hypothetical protein